VVDKLDLGGYHVYHATRADLLRRLGRSTAARAAYDKAIELASNTAEVATSLGGAISLDLIETGWAQPVTHDA
jgi:predicted RNA polymerase sigma factor